jgi:hypothetical protein
MKLNSIRKQVIVVGAGAAGIAAAVAAARNGAETLLVEYNGYLGGISATLGWIGFHDNRYRQVVRGLAAEFVSIMQQRGEASSYVLDPKCCSIVTLNTHIWKIVAIEQCQAAGVQLMLHTHVVDTLREGDRITGVVVEHKTGRQEIHAEVLLDCSGDGDVAARAGVAWEKGRTGDGLVQAPTLVFRLGGLDRESFIEGCKDISNNYREWLSPYPDLWEKMMRRIDTEPAFIIGGFAGLIEKARRAGEFDVPQSRIVGVKTHVPDELLVVTTRVLGLDPTDVTSLTDAYTRIYAQIPILVAFFRKYMPGCSGAHVREIAPMLGVRESRRIVGDYVLTAEDVIEGRTFADVVAMGGYHIDIHRPSGTWVESRNVEAYGIPLRCLIARNVDGLMMAGKCLSATHEAVASTRVIPICMAQGQAAGTAAAMAVQRRCSVRDVSVSDLQARLIDQGAELGQSLTGPDPEVIERIGVLPKEEPPSTGEADLVSMAGTAWVNNAGKINYLLLLAFFLFALPVLAGDEVTRRLGGMRGVVIGDASDAVAKNGEGSMIRLKDGTLLHAFSRHIRPEDSSRYDNADLWPAVIARIESRDKGASWSQPSVMFTSSIGENAMQPSFARLSNGELGVSYSQINSLSSAEKVFRYSSDEGKTWSGEIRIRPKGGYWTSAHDRMIVLKSGRVIHPLHHKLVAVPEHIVTVIAYSDDHGRTWKLGPQRIDGPEPIAEFLALHGKRFRKGFWEASVVEREDGSLYMIGRTYGGWLYSSESLDQGLTWSQPSPTSLMSSAAPGRIQRIPGTRDILVVWNSCCLDPKHPLLGQRLVLSSAISNDNGLTWKWKRDIESVSPGTRVEYPSIEIDEDKVFLTYRAQATGAGGRIMMQEYLSILPLQWFYAERDHHYPEHALQGKGVR